jgi:hypothetical protein
MIAKTKANSSFRGTTKYVVEKAKAQIIGGNTIGTSTDQLVAQFMVSRNLNPKVKDPCYHLMLSLPHNETLSNSQFAALGERHFATVAVLSQLTGDKAKITTPDKRISEEELNAKVDKFLEDEIHAFSFFIARHNDSEHDHIHIVASRINEITSKAIKTWKQYPQSEWSARLLEKRFGLEQIPCSWESKNRALTRSQRDRIAQNGLPGAEIIRQAIEEAARDKPPMPVLIERLAEREIIAEVSYHNNGQVRGIRFSINVGEVDEKGQPKLLSITGGGLNRHKYSFPKLISELGISYIPERDDELLKATTGKAQKLLTAEPIINIPQNFLTKLNKSEDTLPEKSFSIGDEADCLQVNNKKEKSTPSEKDFNSSASVKENDLESEKFSQEREQQPEKIRQIILTATEDKPTFTELLDRLITKGIKPEIQITRTGKIQGISFVAETEEFSGTSLGANYSFKGLQRYLGVDFDLERDVKALAPFATSNSLRKSAIQNQPIESIIQLLLSNRDNVEERERETEVEKEKFTSRAIRESPTPKKEEESSEENNSSKEIESNPLQQLSDAELMACVLKVKQWQKTRPTEPSLNKGESYQKRIGELNQQKAELEEKLRQESLQLKLMGKPRSLFNPFGEKAEVISEKQQAIWTTKRDLGNISREKSRLEADLNQWQLVKEAYQTWLEDPQTKQMKELSVLLSSPSNLLRLERIQLVYAMYAAANDILKQKGIESGNERYYRGNSYRIEERDKTLTISHKDRSEPLYVATDSRETGGIIEVKQLNLTERDKEILLGYASQLNKQVQEKTQASRKGFGIGY